MKYLIILNLVILSSCSSQQKYCDPDGQHKADMVDYCKERVKDKVQLERCIRQMDAIPGCVK